MNAPAAIRGCFADFRLIRSRKVCQLVIELNIEEADAALATLGGLPQPASERWVGIARLNVTSIKPKKERQPFESLESGLQATLRCKQAAFWKFIQETWPGSGKSVNSEERAANWVRVHCEVDSRRELNLDPLAAAKWQELDARYMLWLREPQHA